MAARFRVTNPRAPDKIAQEYTGKIAHEVEASARDDTPVVTGNLKRGWFVSAEAGGNGYRVVNNVPYARFVEYGTRYMRPEAMLGKAVARARAGGA